jgi:hypothetical protein
MPTISIDELIKRAKAFPLFESPLSFSTTLFLPEIDVVCIMDMICIAVFKQAQYILAKINFIPEDLVKSPQIFKQDADEGHYFDIVINEITNLVEGCYIGFTASFGHISAEPCGLVDCVTHGDRSHCAPVSQVLTLTFDLVPNEL